MNVRLELKIDAKIGESPYWDPRYSSLFFVDIPQKSIHQFDFLKKNHVSYSLPQQVGCIVPTDDPSKILAALENCYGFFDLNQKTFESLSFLEKEYPENRFNDGVCDVRGRFIFGSMCPSELLSPQAAVYQLDKDRCMKILDGFFTVNGLAFDRNGTTFYVSDSHPKIQTVWAFDYDPQEGKLSNKRVFFQTFDLPGRPDGAAVDEEGGYWIACIGGHQILRLLPNGTIDRSIRVPIEFPTKVAFGGDDLKTLFITSKSQGASSSLENPSSYSGCLFSVKVDVKGLSVNYFKN